LDAFLDQDIEYAVESVSLPQFVREGLLNKTSQANSRLCLIQALEQGNWAQADAQCDTIEVDNEQIMSLYTDAIQWSDERVSTIHALS